MSNTDLLIRQSLSTDFNEIFDIWLIGQQSSLNIELSIDEAEKYKERLKKLFVEQDDNFKFFVATANNEIIGWQYLMPTENNPWLRNLVAESSTYVRRDYVNSGVGVSLIKKAMKSAKSSDICQIVAKVRRENESVIKMLQVLGWEIIGETKAANKKPGVPYFIYLIYQV